jgi:general secretion pathway protein B
MPVSLILDALSRSRQDENPVPGLGTHHPVGQNLALRRQYLVWVALAVALVVIAWMVVERFSAPPVPVADIGAPVAELSSNIGSVVTSVTTELKARAAASAPPAAVVEQPVAAVSGPQAQTTEPVGAAAANRPAQNPASAALTSPAPNVSQDSADNAEEAVTAPALSAAENAAVAELYQNRELQKDPVMPAPTATAGARPTQGEERGAAAENSRDARTERSIDIDRILQEAREEVKNATLDDHGVPFLADLSQQTKDAIPTLYYQRHDYSSDASVSSIVLNGTPFKVGGSPEPGMKVEEILPDSVVLSYHGTQFRLRALNSWINL